MYNAVHEYIVFSGGASPSPTKSDGDSVYAKQTERLLNGKGGGAGRRGIVRFWKGWCREMTAKI